MTSEPLAAMGSEEPSPSFTQVAPYYDQLMKDVPYRAWARHVLALSRRHGCNPNRIVELACGTATIALLLADNDFTVAGMDCSEPMIQVARQKRDTAGAQLYLSVGDLRNFDLRSLDTTEPFDLALCLYDSLNNILKAEELLSAFKCIQSILKPGGLFIFDVNTDYALRTNMFSQDNMDPESPVQYRWRSHYDYSNSICAVNMQFWVHEDCRCRTFSEVHRQKAYSQVELDRLLRSAGMSLEAAYDGLSVRSPGRRTDRMYCVVRNP